MADAVKELKSLLRAKEEAFQRGREAGIRDAAEAGDKAQQRNDSVERAILALIDKPQERNGNE